MADELTTVLRIDGDSASAQAAVAALMTSLRNAAAEAANLFAPIFGGGKDPLKPLADGLDKIPPLAKPARDSVLALAQATARLQVAEGDAAGAVDTLKTALEDADKGTIKAINAQRQLITVEAQLANAAGKAETAMLREAQAVARLQQISGNTPAAIKTLSDALEKASNKSSLPALRAELQKTYLDTNYANSPLIGAIDRISAGLGFLRPILGSTAGTLQTLTNYAGQAAQSLNNTRASVEANAKSANTFLDRISAVNQAIVNFAKDQGGSASATDFFLNLAKGADVAGDRIRASFASIRDSIANTFTRGLGVQTLGLGNLTQEATALTPALSSVAKAGEGASTSLLGMGTAGSSTALVLGGVVAVVGALIIGLAALTAGASAVTSGLIEIGTAGVKTNAQLESIKIGIDTVIASVAEVRNSDGLQLKGAEALTAVLPIAADQLRKLRIDALETSATIADIAPAFQAAIGPGLVAGLTIDQIRENTIKLTQAVTALGLPLDQIKQETRAILSGDINRNTQAAVALGITREAALEAQKQGKFAEFLEQKLQAAAAAGKLVAQTFAAAQSNLKEAGDTFQAVVTEGLFNRLRDKLNEVLPQIFDKSKANLISDNFKGIADTLTNIFNTAGDRIGQVIDFALAKTKEISAFLDENRALIDQTIASVDTLVESVVNLSASIFDAFSPEKKNLVARIKDAVDGLSLGIARMQDDVELLGATFQLVIQGIVLGIEGPLAGALNFLGLGIDGLNKDVDRLLGGIDSALKRIDEGGKNATQIEQRIKQANDRAENFSAFDKMSKEDKELAALFFGGEGLNVPSPTGPPKTDPKVTIKPPKRTGGGDTGAASKARQEASTLLKLLQTQEKEAELINKRITEGLRQSLTDRLISLQTYTELSIRNDQDLLTKRLNALKEEEKAALATAKNSTDAEAKRAEFRLKRLTLEQDADIKAEALRDDLRRTEERAEEDHQNRLLSIRDAARKAIEASIRASVTSGLIGFEEGEKKQIELERERFAEREGLLNANLELAREDVAKRQEIQDQLELLAVERVAFETEASQRINEAQRKEADGFLDLLRKRIKALVDLRRAQIEAAGARAALDVQRGTLNRAQAEEAEIQRRRDLLKIETSERQADIAREAEELKAQARNRAGAAAAIVEIEKQKNEALKAEKERAAAEDAALENQQRAVNLSPIFGEDAALRIAATEQLLGGTVGVLEQLRIAAQATADGLSVSMPTIGQVFAQSALAVADSTAAIITSFLSGQAPLRKAAAALYAAALEPLKKYLLKKATAEFALAAADFAIGNYAGGTKHTLAGVGLSAAAALIDVGGSLIAGGGGGGAAGAAIAGGGSSAGNTAPETISRDTLADRRQQGPTTIILRPEINLRGDISRGVLEVVHEDIRNNGTTRQLIQETAPTG